MDTMMIAAGAGGGGPRILDMIFTIFTFLVLLALLKKFAWGPLLGMMRQREEYVANEIELAEKSRKDAEHYVVEQREALSAARTESKEMLDASRRQAEAEQARLVEQARLEAEQIKIEAEKAIERERELAKQALQTEVVTLALSAARHVLQSDLKGDEAKQRALVIDFLSKVKGAN